MVEPPRDENQPPASDDGIGTPSLLTQAVYFAVGLGMMPLLGLSLLTKNASHLRPVAEDDPAGRESPGVVGARAVPPRREEPPSRDDVEAALRRLTAATLPKQRVRR